MRFAAGIILALLPNLCGCKGLLMLMNENKTKPVAAECDKLTGKRVAVVVWAENATLDVDPFACDRTAKAIEYFLNQNAGKKELRGTTFVTPQAVAEFQEQVGNAGPTLANDDVARRLKADTVVRIDLFEYTTRAPEANGLIMGRVSGNIAVQVSDEAEPLYKSEASASFPEGTKVGVLDRRDEDVLAETLNMFGERVARKFYAHEEKL